MSRVLLPSLLLSVAMTTSACFGSFAAVQKVYEWNEEISDNKWVQTIVMYGLVMIPAYSLAVYADVLLFNVIEFWTEGNPIAAADAPAGRTRLAQASPDGTVTLMRGNTQYELRPLAGNRVALLVDGRLVGVTVIRDDGALDLLDAEGRLVRHLPAEQVRALHAGVAPLVQAQ